LDHALPSGPFDALAGEVVVVANGDGAAHIDVLPGQARTVALRIISRGDGAHAARVSVSIEAGGALTLLESYEGEGHYLSQTSLMFDLGAGAALERIVLAADDAEGVTVSEARVDLSPNAAMAQTVLTTGGRRQRLETQVRHPGGHAELKLDGVYLLAGKRHADLTTVVTHAGVDGTTQQLTKGVVRDQARGVFQGRIVVAEGADRTDAKMGHHALILSDRAEVDAKPELEIYADDVACAHGNTVGALDEDALFYARQRGMPEDVARGLLIEAFIGEVVDRIGHEGAREAARAWVAERLAP
jgi:Fe-S cluster assembly protein SufD